MMHGCRVLRKLSESYSNSVTSALLRASELQSAEIYGIFH